MDWPGKGWKGHGGAALMLGRNPRNVCDTDHVFVSEAAMRYRQVEKIAGLLFCPITPMHANPD
jgi:hypothetical protein